MENGVRRQTMTNNQTQAQNIDDDIRDMLEYYNELPDIQCNTLEMEMLDHGVSWSDFF